MGNEKNKRSVREELEVISPQLARLKEQVPPVDIPTGYFDQLSDNVMRQIREEAAITRKPVTESPRQPWWSVLFNTFQQPAYALALASVVILLVSVLVLRPDNQAQTGIELTMSEEDINDYINYHIDDFDLGLLAEEAADDPEEELLFMEEEELEKGAMDEYFDELLDEIDLEELL